MRDRSCGSGRYRCAAARREFFKEMAELLVRLGSAVETFPRSANKADELVRGVDRDDERARNAVAATYEDRLNVVRERPNFGVTCGYLLPVLERQQRFGGAGR